MKSLILMRHAKSDWSRPGQRDHDRVLNPRGRRAAALMGAWLEGEGYAPDAALVSDAARAQETWERLSPLLSDAPDATFRDDLYLCDPETILAAVQAAPDCRRLLILGHNPGMAVAMMRFSEVPKRLEAPTAAIAVYELPIKHWKDAVFGGGMLVAFQVPKALV